MTRQIEGRTIEGYAGTRMIGGRKGEGEDSFVAKIYRMEGREGEIHVDVPLGDALSAAVTPMGPYAGCTPVLD